MKQWRTRELLERPGTRIAAVAKRRLGWSDRPASEHMALDPHDFDSILARHAARVAGQSPQPGEPTANDDVAALIDALRESRRELDDVRDLCEDLRASAELWATLYAANVERANAAEEERDRLAGVSRAK